MRIFLLVFLCTIFAVPVFANDNYIEGYVAATMKAKYEKLHYEQTVNGGLLTLRIVSDDDVLRKQLLAEFKGVPGIREVSILPMADSAKDSVPARPAAVEYDLGFFPKGTIFEPLIADPKWPRFAVAYQNFSKDSELANVGFTALGGELPIYRNKISDGFWQAGIQAGVTSIFDLDASSTDLVNADYYVAVPLAYRQRSFSSLLRIFHQSSHLGDEYLLRSRINRVNLSYEGLDALLSFDVGKVARVYGGGAYLFRRDPAELKKFSIQYGVELYSPWTMWDGVMQPIAAIDIRQYEENKWDHEFSARGGFRFHNRFREGQKLDLLFEYFHGQSPHGQFYARPIQYTGVSLNYYF